MIIPVAIAHVVEALEKLAPQETNMVEDIEAFHKKFRLSYTGKPRALTKGMSDFRVGFMEEELDEYKHAVKKKDLEGQFDALIDLIYVALGTAYIQGFDFEEGWRRVQEANMSKMRVENAADSKRKSSYDVIKPEGWTPPDLSDLV
jgi:predicted HAD superfamily Cof-like phosphohydrolase